MTLSFAALCEFYSRGKQNQEGFTGVRDVSGASLSYPIVDDATVIRFFTKNGGKEGLVSLFAAREDFWGQDLNRLPGFTAEVSRYLAMVRESGVRNAVRAAAQQWE